MMDGGGGAGYAGKRTNSSQHASRVMILAVWCFLGVSLFASLFNGSARLAEAPVLLKQAVNVLDEAPATSPLEPNPPGSEHETGDNAFSLLSPTLQTQLSLAGLKPSRQHDRTMDDATCRREFPLLYPQLDELQSWWMRKGGLKRATLDRLEKTADAHWGHVRLIIHNGQIFVRSFKEGQETRNSALIQQLQEAVYSWPFSAEKDSVRSHLFGGSSSNSDGSSSTRHELPTIDLILSPGDRDGFSDEGGWMVTKNVHDHKHKGTWLIPDFGFTGWPEAGAGSYGEFLELAERVEEQYPWSKKHNRLFWRGYANFYPVRRDLMQRTMLKEHPERAQWADVHETTFHNDTGDFVPIVAPHDHCQHKFLIHTEGNSYSGRSKYLLSCHSIVVAHPMNWTQHFHPALNHLSTSSDQNYVQLPGPLFDGLEEAALELQHADSSKEAQTQVVADHHRRLPPSKVLGRNTPKQIADNAKRTLRDRYLSPAATACYTRAALRYYAASLDTSSWGATGPTVLPGQGIKPGVSKGQTFGTDLKGDIEVGIWRLLGSPNWPPTAH